MLRRRIDEAKRDIFILHTPSNQILLTKNQKRVMQPTLWLPHDDEFMTRYVEENGRKWRDLQLIFPGRSASSIRNRWQRMQNFNSNNKNKCRFCGLPRRGHSCGIVPNVRFKCKEPSKREFQTSLDGCVIPWASKKETDMLMENVLACRETLTFYDFSDGHEAFPTSPLRIM